MGNLRKKLKTNQGTSTAPNQPTTSTDTIENLVNKVESSNSSNNRGESNAVDERCHRHHLGQLEHSPSSAMLLQYEKLIREHRDNELNELKRIIDSYKQELLLNQNRIKQLTVENNNLKDALRAAQNNGNDTVISEYQSGIDNSVSQLKNSNEKDFNDCLLKIFSYLSIDDMMRVKNVCRIWREVSQQWFEQVQTLVFNGFDTFQVALHEKYHKRKVYENNNIRDEDEVIPFLRSCGHHIKYYEAADYPGTSNTEDKQEEFMFHTVPEHCQNIVDIDIYVENFYPTELNFESMATYWDKLEKIKIKDLPRWITPQFLKLLARNRNLKSLSIVFQNLYKFRTYVNDKFFLYIPATIEKISIKNLSVSKKEKFSNFIPACNNFTSLQSLELTELQFLTNDMMEAIAEIKSLTHLSLSKVYKFESRGTINEIAKIKGLKSLKLTNVYYVYEDNIIKIVESCIQLETLYIPDVHPFTDRGLAAIVKLKNLKRLDIYMHSVINESIINSCRRLEMLWCSDLTINNNKAIEMFKKLTNLRYVHFLHCKNFTKDIIQAANKIANKRKNNVLYVTTTTSYSDIEDMDTPYFKHVGHDEEILPDDIRDEIKEKYGECK